jgi:hypothetical protein
MHRWGQGWPLRSGRRRLVTRSQSRRTPPPRGAESAHPGRISTVRNVTTPSGSGRWPGKPTVREAQLPGGSRTIQEANAGASKGDGKRDSKAAPFVVIPHNRPDTGVCLARKGADVDRVSL